MEQNFISIDCELTQKEQKLFLRTKVTELLDEYLVKKGYLKTIHSIGFTHEYMSEEVAESIIGLVNYKNNTNNIDFLDVASTLKHDIVGILNQEECFIPKCLGFRKYFNN